MNKKILMSILLMFILVSSIAVAENNSEQTKIIDQQINFTEEINFQLEEEISIFLQETNIEGTQENHYVTLLLRPQRKEIRIHNQKTQAIDINDDDIPDILVTINNITTTSTNIIVYRTSERDHQENEEENNPIAITNTYVLIIMGIVVLGLIFIFFNFFNKKHHKKEIITQAKENKNKFSESVRSELMNYIAKAIENNLTDEQIIANLTNAGWKEMDVREAIKKIKSI